MTDEKEILRQCAQNNSKAQRLLYERYAPALLGICVRFTGNREEAEDVLQEAFVKIFLNIKDFEGRSSLMSWMRRIAINTAITLYHKNLKHRHHYDVDDFSERSIGDCEPEDLDFTREEMLKVIAGLPAGYRMVFNLYALEGYKHKEIAEEMGIDINTSKSQYSRARKLIQCKLAGLKREAKEENEQE
jgi:RNA polymerase sigma-70 factor (ECF subfamily)